MMAGIREIDAAIAAAEATTGVRGTVTRVPATISSKAKTKSRLWTEKEEQFLIENHGRMSDLEIGLRLGRTASGVENHWKRELHLKAPSKLDTTLTGEHVAMGLCIDSHSVSRLAERGILSMRRINYWHRNGPRDRHIKVVDRHLFMRWLLDPANWCYFKPRRVGTMRRRGKRAYTGVDDHEFWEKARIAVRRAFRAWKDKWLTPAQAGRILKLKGRAGDHNINKGIRVGTLKATRWGNWWIRRSDLPMKGTINAKGLLVDRILTHRERGKIQSKRFWDAVRAGKKPMPSRMNKAPQKARFMRLMEGGASASSARKVVKVSGTTAYGWLRREWGRNWRRKARRIRMAKRGRKT